MQAWLRSQRVQARGGRIVNITDKVLLMNLSNLSQDDIAYLHKLKTLATVLKARLDLRDMKLQEKLDHE